MYIVTWYNRTYRFPSYIEACVAYDRFFETLELTCSKENLDFFMGICTIKSMDKTIAVFDALRTGAFWRGRLENYEFYNANLFRCTPVQGTGRRGYGRYYRRIRTTNEHRLNMGVMLDEGKMLVRGPRRNLPNSWDDIGRTIQRSWKVQGKGRKSWSLH